MGAEIKLEIVNYAHQDSKNPIDNKNYDIFDVLRACLFTDEDVSLFDWQSVFNEMKQQTVAALPGIWLRSHLNAEPWLSYCTLQLAHWVRVMHAQDQLLQLLEDNNIPCVILKGAAAAMAYPHPMLRTMGDVDFLVKRDDFESAAALLEGNGYVLSEERDAVSHHYGYAKDHISFELHKRIPIVSESDEKWMSVFEKGIDSREWQETKGHRYPVLPKLLNGLVLIFHIYVCENHPEIEAYFTITNDSCDKHKVDSYRKTVKQNSMKHYLYCLIAKVSANSQAFGAIPDPTGFLFPYVKKLKRKDQVVIHLKHGITKDELPHVLDYTYTQFDLLCCVSERERRFMQKVHGYPDENIKVTGFCRYDNLLKEHEIKKQILIMPTHRIWLHATDTDKKASVHECEKFMQSDYYSAYASLLNDENLIEFLQKVGYQLVFYPHYAMQPYIGCFKCLCNDVISIADRENSDVQQLLMESALLVTDYSSVFFDFAYMDKPVIYYQFDEEQYRSGHFKKGYFDYRNDGFGPVLEKERAVLSEVKRIIQNDCKLDDTYKRRVDAFFTLRDAKNCERVFNEVYGKVMAK